MKRLLGAGALLAVSFSFFGCSHAWIVRRDTQGGVIGYRGYDDAQEANQAISSLVHCPYGYVGVSDDMRSAPYQYTTYETVRTYGTRNTYSHYGRPGKSYTDSYTTQIPVTKTGTSYWREFSFRCKGVNESTVSSTSNGVQINPMAE